MDEAILDYVANGRSPEYEGASWTWDVQSRPRSDEIELLLIELRGARSGISRQVAPDEVLDLIFHYRQHQNLSHERMFFSC